MLCRRDFLTTTALASSALCVQGAAPLRSSPEVAFFFIGDTHYLADRKRPEMLDAVSREHTSRLVDVLNRLPNTAIPDALGGGKVRTPLGVIHAGDLIDTGDKTGAANLAMQRTEWRAFETDFGLTGKDGKLNFPVYEVHGNHDAPQGTGLVIDQIKQRNKTRPGVLHVSANGLHYSWDWGPIHFVNLGIVVGEVKKTNRRRRYPPLDSLDFLVADLAKFAADKKKPIILTHHIDVLRYSDECDPNAKTRNPEWDPCDVQGYHDVIKSRNVLGVLYGHTHARNVFRWDGSKVRQNKGGIPVFNTTKSSHFNSKEQGVMYFEVVGKELVVREYGTKDAWRNAAWSAVSWRVALG